MNKDNLPLHVAEPKLYNEIKELVKDADKVGYKRGFNTGWFYGWLISSAVCIVYLITGAILK